VPEVSDLYDSLTAAEYATFVGELYGLSAEEAEGKAERLMELFGLGEAYRARISSFSKGMRQKTMIVCSLLHDPDVLFLDEPLSGLDANSVLIVKELMARLADRGKTIFYSSHIMEVVEKISHRIVLIDGGKVAADGTFEELSAQNEKGTLEDIFNRLTGFNEHKELAERFAEIVSERRP
jgi:ABC-2 type transport system ATP-binding protein